MANHWKSCPFCGASENDRVIIDGGQLPVLRLANADKTPKGAYAIKCGECGAFGPADNSIQKAIEKWNTRPAGQGENAGGAQ